jgi:Na+/H+ antiporter NhaD/arsenite permease-like protein
LALGLDAIADRTRQSAPSRGGRAGTGGHGKVRSEFVSRMRRMPLEIVPFFLSFCIVLRVFDEAGLTRYAVQGVVNAFKHGPLVGSLATTSYAVLAVNLANNIPATILFEKAWLGNVAASQPIVGLVDRLRAMNPRYADIFVDGSLFASNFGANLTFIGALAGLMWLRIIRDQAARAPEVRRLPTARDFLVWGGIIVPIVTLATSVAIALPAMLDR